MSNAIIVGCNSMAKPANQIKTTLSCISLARLSSPFALVADLQF
jgi:hypothetical protein